MGSSASAAGRRPGASQVRRAPGPAPYATAWTVASAIACTCGLVVVALSAPIGQVLALVGASLGMGGVGGCLFIAVTERFEPRLIASGAGWTCLALMGGWGLFRLWPLAGGGAVLALAVLSPWTLTGLRRLTTAGAPRSARRRRSHHGFTVEHPAVLGFLEELGRASAAPVFPLHPLADLRPDDRSWHGPDLVDSGGAPIGAEPPEASEEAPGDDDWCDQPTSDGIGDDDIGDDVFELRAADPDEVLCEAWVASSVALGQTHTEAGRLAVIRSRQFLLDQLEKRDPEAFARWLASRPRAEDDPSAYFPGQGRQRH